MKVSNVSTYLWDPGAGKNFLFVKIETDAGITGWGEAYTQADRDTQVEEHVKQLARYLEGRDPFHIRHFLHVVHEDFATKRGGMDLHCAVSGIEIALWDIVGKALERPIYDLLGGPVRPRLQALRQWLVGWRYARRVRRASCDTGRRTGIQGVEVRPVSRTLDGISAS